MEEEEERKEEIESTLYRYLEGWTEWLQGSGREAEIY